MRKQTINLVALFLSGLLLLSLAGCSSNNENVPNRETNKTDETSAADCIINGRELYFIDAETKKEWK